MCFLCYVCAGGVAEAESASFKLDSRMLYAIFIKLQEVVSWFARTAVLFSMASFALTAGRPLTL